MTMREKETLAETTIGKCGGGGGGGGGAGVPHIFQGESSLNNSKKLQTPNNIRNFFSKLKLKYR